MIEDGESYFYHADGLGSIVAMTDDALNIVQHYSYDSFGMPTLSDPDFSQPYTFTGREWDDETELYFYRARYYDPSAGRFISKDPIGFNGGDVTLYGYVGNNPISLIDPWGLKARGVLVPIRNAFKKNVSGSDIFIEIIETGLSIPVTAPTVSLTIMAPTQIGPSNESIYMSRGPNLGLTTSDRITIYNYLSLGFEPPQEILNKLKHNIKNIKYKEGFCDEK